MTDYRNQSAWSGVDGGSVADAAAIFANAPTRRSDSIDPESLRANNMLSAAAAYVAVDAYARHRKQLKSESAHTTICDLLSDVHHLCDALGVDWDAVSNGRYYDDEVTGRI